MTPQQLIAEFERLKALDKPYELVLRTRAVPKGRPRMGKNKRVYTPKTTIEFERRVRASAKTCMPKPYACPVAISVVMYEPIPASFPSYKTMAAKLNMITPPRGDLDNRVKAIKDGLNTVAYWDDNQVGHMWAAKYYGDEYLIKVKISRFGLSPQEIDDLRNG